MSPIRETIIHELREQGGSLPYNDKSDPQDIRDVFGVSKKAFKQAIGSLYKEQEIIIEDSGIRLATEEEKRAPKKKSAASRARESEKRPEPRSSSPWGRRPE